MKPIDDENINKTNVTLEERLRTRFEWGLIADINPPDYETRMAILIKNAEIYEKKIDEEIIKYIATNVKSNIRELEGSLNKLIALHKLKNEEITREELNSIIDSNLDEDAIFILVLFLAIYALNARGYEFFISSICFNRFLRFFCSFFSFI